MKVIYNQEKCLTELNSLCITYDGRRFNKSILEEILIILESVDVYCRESIKLSTIQNANEGDYTNEQLSDMLFAGDDPTMMLYDLLFSDTTHTFYHWDQPDLNKELLNKIYEILKQNYSFIIN